MADPVSMMAVASLVTTAAGAGVSAFGSYQQGQAQSGMYNYQARVAQINSQINQGNANQAIAASEVQEQAEGIKGAETVGETKAGIGAGNLDIGSGSAKKVIASEEEVTQSGEATIANRGAREAYGFETAAFGDVAQANLDVAAGSQSVIGGDIGAYSSVLGGASSVSTKWTQFGTEGIPPFAQA